MPRIAEFDPSELSKRFRSVILSISNVLSRREEIRDTLIKMGRDIIRLSGWAINSLHRGAVDEASRYIDEMDRIMASFRKLSSEDSFIRESGFVYNVLAEYVEAKTFYMIVVRGAIPTPEELGVSEIPYLQGIGDVLGELRRLSLDLMRVGALDDAERVLDLMEQLYYELRALEYPDALMPGVRHKVDVARRLIDDTKALLLSLKARRC